MDDSKNGGGGEMNFPPLRVFLADSLNKGNSFGVREGAKNTKGGGYSVFFGGRRGKQAF